MWPKIDILCNWCGGGGRNGEGIPRSHVNALNSEFLVKCRCRCFISVLDAFQGAWLFTLKAEGVPFPEWTLLL